MTQSILTRRRFFVGGALGTGALALGGASVFVRQTDLEAILHSAEVLTMSAQRKLLAQWPLAREFTVADISPTFRVNGTHVPESDEYTALLENGFADWRLKVVGLVDRPLALCLSDLRKLPSRTQITRHDCVEGWSAIGQWTGVPLGPILKAAGLKPNARFVVFHCADELERTLDGSGRYYESIDLGDAFHPQTILAYAMNGADLSVGHGAPLRLRVERQLGYKQAKYLMGIEVVDNFDRFFGGKGGFWEDRGYEWYAGI
ncbi:molybdopterin-binding protein [Aureimonas sp. AU4]|uniref:molybdopterin-binding protein n=1 Tax=Aureimonas sp. AU4 TaxID=1638163 RepID=UPI000784FDC5|nr:molybdopterin-binding protein [Aureimonas sp. AU4]